MTHPALTDEIHSILLRAEAEVIRAMRAALSDPTCVKINAPHINDATVSKVPSVGASAQIPSVMDCSS